MADQRRFDTLEQTAARTAQQLAEDTSTIFGRLATHTHPEYALADVATPPYARYIAAGGGSFTFSGARQRVQFATAQDTHPEIVPGGTGNNYFQLNRAGVWRMEAGVRLSAATANQTRYFNITDANDMTGGGFVETQELRTTSGGAYSVAVSRRVTSGIFVGASLLVLGSGSTATVASDILDVSFISLTWVRP